jgi:hypothetical protein
MGSERPPPIERSPMNKLWLCGALLCGLWPYPAHVSAHNADELKAVFEPTPVPQELIEATKELNATAGMKSIREEAHDKQHALLDQYLRALLDKQCRESLENIARIDRQIVEVRDTGNTEPEQNLRHLRDETAAFVEAKCADISTDNLPKQQP